MSSVDADGAVDEVEAHGLAVSSDVPVEVTAARSETRTVFANPDGTTSVELSATPVRVRDGDGWAVPDPTLEVTGSGLAPVATSVPVVFSAGGSGPLVSVVRGGVSVEFFWPTSVPAPTLDGDGAVYADVLPDVDLRVRALVGGFSQVLVVKTAEAAANPALQELTMATAVDGGELVESGTGGLDVVDRFGFPVLSADQALMWDSSGADPGGAPAPASATPMSPSSPSWATSGVDAETPAEARLTGPLPGDEVAAMGVSVAPDALTIVPDEQLLTSADTTFPLYIDPTLVERDPHDWAMVMKQYPDQEFHQWSTAGGEGVGYQNENGVSTKRLFWDFSLAYLQDKKVVDAQFSAYETHSWSCTKSTVNLYRTGNVNYATNWNNQPAWSFKLDARWVAHGWSADCNQWGAWVEFADASIAQSIQNTLDSSSPNWFNLGLRADSETDPVGWKRFREDALLTIRVSGPPKISSTHANNPYIPCVSQSAERPVIPKQDPLLNAEIADPDPGDTLRAQFVFETAGGTDLWATTTAPLARGFTHRAQIPESEIEAGVAIATSFRWGVRAVDSSGLTSAWRFCYFTIDAVAPGMPRISTTADEFVLNQPAVFTIGRPAGATDVAYYRWSLNNDVPTSGQVPVGSPTISVTANTVGPSMLRVWAYDEAGNQTLNSQVGEFRMDVPPAQSTALYPLDVDDADPSTSTDVTGANALSLAAGVVWAGVGQVPGLEDSSLEFDGSGAAAAATGPVAPSGQNVTVTAWVQVADVSRSRVAVSQDGPGGTAMSLGVKTSCPGGLAACYAFTVANPNSPSAVKLASVFSTQPAVADGSWVHLTGSYSPHTDEVQLYVTADPLNVGEPTQGQVAFSGNATASSMFRVGRGTTSAAAAADPWLGRVDDVGVYTGWLSEDEVTTAVDGYLRPRD
ncbi:MAG: LamG-like jellyroll fold domain-containing protein [Micromonosporaceae bacterium]